jgi:hypothetical protein
MDMKTLLKAEEAAELVMAYVVSLLLGYSWWIFFALLFLPDLFMAGYAVNKKAGAWLYNLAHHKGVAVLIGLAALAVSSHAGMMGACVLFGHSALDRMLGFGLKYSDDFKHTHMGWIGERTV